jgi:hypothetical protein
MSNERTPKMAGFCILSAFIGTLLILHTSLVLAQAPSFLPVVTYDSGGHEALSAAVADVNGDSHPDLVVANWYGCSTCSEGNVGVLLNNGDGTFQSPVSYGSGGGSVISVAVADVNTDGHPDLIVLNQLQSGNPLGSGNGGVSVLLGNGDGTFQKAVAYNLTAGPYAESVAVGDVNRDGRPDLVVASLHVVHNSNHGLVSVLLNRGDGTFTSPATYSSGGAAPISVAMGDVNGDSKPDLVAVNQGSSTGNCCYSVIGVLLGNGDGTFQEAASYNSGGGIASSVAIEDLNDDGHSDLVVGNGCQSPGRNGCVGQSGEVGVLLGNGDGTFQPALTYNSGGAIAHSVVIDDLNGDGHPDVVVANFCKNLDPGTGDCNGKPGLVSVLTGKGDGTFQTAVSLNSGGSSGYSVATGDLNGDGKPDIVVANTDSTVGVLLNNTLVCTTPPELTLAASPSVLWPPNGRFVPVTVSGKIILGTGCVLENVAYAVEDEYGKVQPTEPITLGDGGRYSVTAWLQASRLGTDLDGRLYTITVSASNNAGKTGSQAGAVNVPHDQGH